MNIKLTGEESLKEIFHELKKLERLRSARTDVPYVDVRVTHDSTIEGFCHDESVVIIKLYLLPGDPVLSNGQDRTFYISENKKCIYQTFVLGKKVLYKISIKCAISKIQFFVDSVREVCDYSIVQEEPISIN